MNVPARVLALGSVAVLVLVSACGGKTSAPPTTTASATAEPSATATAPATASPTATATPDASIPGIQPIRLRAGEPVPFPAGVALYAIDGTWEGPSAALRRYYADPSGAMRTDDLIVSDFTVTDPSTRAVTGARSGPGARQLAVALCHGFCYGELQPVTIVRSDDGGVSWTEVGTVKEGGWDTVVAVSGDGVVVRGVKPGDFASTATLPLTAPQQTVSFPASVVAAGAPIMAATIEGKLVLIALGKDARTLWNLDGSGAVFTSIPLSAGAQVRTWEMRLVPHSTGLELHVPWTDAARAGYLGLLNVRDGKFRAAYSFTEEDGLSDLIVTEWLSETIAIGRAGFEASRYPVTAPEKWFRGVPAIIDFGTGTVSPIADFVRFLGGKAGGPFPIGAAKGPFARVTLGAGECLNLRNLPELAGSVLTCVPGGTLLTYSSRRVETSKDGIRWLWVTTPGGLTGWASTSYLEY
ncbi:MAG: SH3 domain-containing protein [Chloroflexi bacterium]|nr:SH3 domain-containing protein [Chloroflexota bacterium]